MTAKEYLLEVESMESRIEQLQEQKVMFLDMATSITASLDPVKVQSSSPSDRMAAAVMKAVDIDKKIDEEVAALYEHKFKVIKQIQALHDVKYIRVLYKVYVQHKSIRCASIEMKMSYQYIREVHKKALEEFEKVYTDMLGERKAG